MIAVTTLRDEQIGMRLLRLMPQERGDLGIRPQLCQFLGRRQLRLVAGGVDHAKEPERLALSGAKLVPRHRRHGDEIARLDRPHLAADQAVVKLAQDL